MPRTLVGHTLLKVGDIWEAGDEYGVGFCFKIGVETGDRPGVDQVRQEQMCYKPRRPIYIDEERPFSPKRTFFRVLDEAVQTRRIIKPTCGWLDMRTGFSFAGQPPRNRIDRQRMIWRRRLAQLIHRLANRLHGLGNKVDLSYP